MYLDGKECGKCHVRDISIVKIENDLQDTPESIRDIVEPSFEKLSNIQFASKFQYVQLTDRIQHYEKENRSLRDKNCRLKDLLKKSRVELDKCNEYQKEIVRLREERDRLALKLQIRENTSSGSHGKRSVDDLQEISMEEYVVSRGENMDKCKSRNQKPAEDFMSKMRRFSQLGGVNINNDRSSSLTHNSDNNSSSGNTGIETMLRKGVIGSFNIEAESTGMGFRNSNDRSSSLHITSLGSKKDRVTTTARGYVPATATATSTGGKRLSKFSFKPPSVVGVNKNLSGSSVGIGVGTGVTSRTKDSRSGFSRLNSIRSSRETWK